MVSYRRKGRQPLSAGQYFALDRIQSVALDKEHPFKKCVDFDPEHFFDDTIGVTKGIHDKARRVVIKIDRQQAPYVESKPFHKSQKVEQRFRDGSIQLSLKVVINNELERLILGYGGHAEVIAPPEFRARIAESVSIAASHYNRAKNSVQSFITFEKSEENHATISQLSGVTDRTVSLDARYTSLRNFDLRSALFAYIQALFQYCRLHL